MLITGRERSTRFASSSHDWFLSPTTHKHHPLHRLAQEGTPLHKEVSHYPSLVHSAHVPGRSKRRLLVLVSKTGSTGVSLLVVSVPSPHFTFHMVYSSVSEHRYFLVTETLTTDGPGQLSLVRITMATALPVVGASWGCWEGVAGRLVADGGSSERAPPWADNILDHRRGGPTSTKDSDYGLPEAGRRLMPAVTSRATGNLGMYWESAGLSPHCLGRRAAAASPCWRPLRMRNLGQRPLSMSGSPYGDHRLTPAALARAQCQPTSHSTAWATV